MSYIAYCEMLGDDVTKMRAAEHVDFETKEAFGTVFFKDSSPLLAYVYTWSGPGPREILEAQGYRVIEVVSRGNGHYSIALRAPDA